MNVKAFLLSRTDIERMLLPLLRVVYDAESHSTHHMYMILIILLILTHDDHFSSYIHDLVSCFLSFNPYRASQIFVPVIIMVRVKSPQYFVSVILLRKEIVTRHQHKYNNKSNLTFYTTSLV